MTERFGILISPICSILTPICPPFFLYYEKGELVGLLTVYADDQDVDVAILVHPNHRRQGIAQALYRSFEKETASYPIESVTFKQSVFSRESS